MITCKLCNTILEKKHLRRDGSMLCPECGQVYWKAAVEKAMLDLTDSVDLKNQTESKNRHGSKRSTKLVFRKVKVA